MSVTRDIGKLSPLSSTFPQRFHMRLTVGAALSLLALTATPLSAQQFFNVGQEIDGKVNVEIIGTLSDGSGDYHPLEGQALTLYRNATDSMQLSLGDAGILHFAIVPGTYRVATLAQWRGRTYRWNLPLSVQRGMHSVALNSENAAITASSERVARRDGAPRADPRVEVVARPDRELTRSNKDGSVATLWSFLITGAGQIYAGESGKGWGLMALGVVTGVTGIAAANASVNSAAYGDSNSGAESAATGLLVISVGTWIYSLVDAHSAVARYNERNGYAVQPILAPSGAGRARIGLAFAVR
jgi:hypothetical protein